MPQRLHEEPREVAAGAVTALERLFRSEDPRLHADVVSKGFLHVLIQRDQDVDHAPARHRVARARALDELGEFRAERPRTEVRLEVALEGRGVHEREVLGVLLQEEVERIDDGHLRDQVHLEDELGRGLLKDQPRLVVSEGILLPVEKVRVRLDAQGVRDDGRPAVRRGPEPHDVRRGVDRPIVAVTTRMVERDADAHGVPTVPPPSLRPRFVRGRGRWGLVQRRRDEVRATRCCHPCRPKAEGPHGCRGFAGGVGSFASLLRNIRRWGLQGDEVKAQVLGGAFEVGHNTLAVVGLVPVLTFFDEGLAVLEHAVDEHG